MRLRLQFGSTEPLREMNWHKGVKEFPNLVIYKNKKWEFFAYDRDPLNIVDYQLVFTELPSYHPNWHATVYENIDHLLAPALKGDCECGAAHTDFPQIHLSYCPKWSARP